MNKEKVLANAKKRLEGLEKSKKDRTYAWKLSDLNAEIYFLEQKIIALEKQDETTE